MVEVSRAFGCWRSGVAVVVSVATVLVASQQASAARGGGSFYGTDGPNISVAALDGGDSPQKLFTGKLLPGAVTPDPAAGKIYWSVYDGVASQVIRGNLDGSGTPQRLYTEQRHPPPFALDPGAGKVYWFLDDGQGIAVGNLDGSGTPRTLATPGLVILGAAIDPAAGKVYWAGSTNWYDGDQGQIGVINLRGNGKPRTLYKGEGLPLDVGVAAGKIYWTDSFRPGVVRVGSVDGSASPQTLFIGGPTTDFAIYPGAGKIYWSESRSVIVRNLDGSGTSSVLLRFPFPSNFVMRALLRPPSGVGAPEISGGSGVGSALTCSEGAWGSDLIGARLYHAPRRFTYQWRMHGTDIPGATSTSYTAPVGGSYRCRVTAHNLAGSTAQTSAPHTVNPPPPNSPRSGKSHHPWAKA
jgi:hypothetical protein